MALILILFLNFLTLLFFRGAVAWGTDEAERRADEMLHRIALSSSRADGTDETMERAAIEPDVVYLALYDGAARGCARSGRGTRRARSRTPGRRSAASRTRGNPSRSCSWRPSRPRSATS